MMFGIRDYFDYIECSRCGCVAIAEIPNNLSDYYPSTYYAHQPVSEPSRVVTWLRRFLSDVGLSRRRHVARFYLRRNYLPGRLLERTYTDAAKRAVLPPWLTSAGHSLGLSFRSRILDVGCGTGRLLLDLRRAGFTNLWGADPFIEADSDHDGVTLLKTELDRLDDRFDFIMLHHSFEHVPDPARTLRDLHRLIRVGGVVLIRTPVARSVAWRRYGVNWVQLDAPRHLHIQTPESMRMLAATAGFDIMSVAFDSTGFQFWGSEQYCRDIPLMDERSFAMNPDKSEISRADVDAYDIEAMALNRREAGDQACFYLRRHA